MAVSMSVAPEPPIAEPHVREGFAQSHYTKVNIRPFDIEPDKLTIHQHTRYTVVLTCRYSQPGTSANRVGMYEYISHSLMSIFTLKLLQSPRPVHCMPHCAVSWKPPTPVRLMTLLGSSTAHVHFSSGIVRTGMNDLSDSPDDTSQWSGDWQW